MCPGLKRCSCNPGGVTLSGCTFNEPRTGVLTLAPHANSRLALVLMANTLDALTDVVSLATPTIPPMTRSPVYIHVTSYHARARL